VKNIEGVDISYEQVLNFGSKKGSYFSEHYAAKAEQK